MATKKIVPLKKTPAKSAAKPLVKTLPKAAVPVKKAVAKVPAHIAKREASKLAWAKDPAGATVLDTSLQAAATAVAMLDAGLKDGPATSQAVDVDAILAERGARYGKFTRHAKITQDLKRVMFGAKSRDEMADDIVEALEMLAHKVGRILNGDHEYADSWADLSGYSKLVADRLSGVEV